jgi:hypothetical protein
MFPAAMILEVIEVVRFLPEAGEAIAAWFRATPEATPEQVSLMLEEYRGEVEKRRASVAEFNKGL